MIEFAGSIEIKKSLYFGIKTYNSIPYHHPKGFYGLFLNSNQKWRELVCVIDYFLIDDGIIVAFMDSLGEEHGMRVEFFFKENFVTPRGILPRYSLNQGGEQRAKILVTDEGRQLSNG